MFLKLKKFSHFSKIISFCFSTVNGGRGGVCRIVVGKPEGKRPIGRPRHRWEDNIKMDLQGVW